MAAVVTAGCVGPSAQVPEISAESEKEEIRRQNAMAIDSIIEQNQRLLDIAWPVAAKGVAICGEDSKFSAGYLVVEPEYFPEHLIEEMNARYGMGEKPEEEEVLSGDADPDKEQAPPQSGAQEQDAPAADAEATAAAESDASDGDQDRFVVISVAGHSPAMQAGMRPGDLIVSLNGEKFDGKNKLKGDGEENLFLVRRGDATVELALIAEKVCKYPIALAFDNQVNAFADGDNVIITSGLMRALTDHQVQVVVAHELAHNLRKHIEAQKTNAAIGTIIDLAVIIGTGINPGMRSLAVMHYSEDFEAEADYVAMYILAEAGFDLEQVPDIWRRMTILNPAVDQSASSIFGRSHPTNAQRFLAMEKAIEEIRGKQAAGEEMLPNIRPE